MSNRKNVLLVLTLLGSSLGLGCTRVGNTKPVILQNSKTLLGQIPPVLQETPIPRRAEFLSKVSYPPIQANTQVSGGKQIVNKLPLSLDKTPLLPRAEFLSQSLPKQIRHGSQISLNGRRFIVSWKQWQSGKKVRTGISDVGGMQTLGMELLSTRDLKQQPIQWFTTPPITPLILSSKLSGLYRYLDVTDFAKIAGWKLQVQGDTLQITSVPARLGNIVQGPQAWGSRIIVELDRPTPWQVSDRRTEGVITLEALADPSFIERFNAPPTQQTQDAEDAAPVSAGAQGETPVIRLEAGQNQTTLRVDIPAGKRMLVYSVPNPNRLVIDLRPDAMIEKEILWAPGIKWRQQYLTLGESRFPVVWLEVDKRTSGVSFSPIWSNPATQTGTAPLLQTAQLWQAFAAINAGFFNRNNQLPLGAVRRDNRWFSGPILNRGAIAWNNNGQFKFGRLSLTETLLTSTGASLPILFLNSGYVQPGIARYTPEWGQTYTPLADNEVVVVVQNNQVTGQIPGGIAGQTSVPIPPNGYLLTLRTNGDNANFLGVGTQLRLQQSTQPADFGSYPHILGAGPLLMQNGQIVLDAKGEQFNDAFVQQSAVRSAIGTTSGGSLMIAAIHNRVGGRGPTLTETAQLMQLLGANDALNFDGGSSTGLYLGGQLLDRSSYTAARVHNGLGLFRPSSP